MANVPGNGTKSKVRVLVVDDSAFARSVIGRQLGADSEIEVVGYAGDGFEALEQVRALRPDVVTLDISMPRMDGLETLDRIVQEIPTPTVMVSALTTEGAAITLEALERGAVDFVLKPVRAGVPVLDGMSMDLCTKVKQAAGARVAVLTRTTSGETPHRKAAVRWRDRIIVIGCSTGGPNALATVIPRLPADMDIPVLIVQHMPQGFTASLAERLNGLSKIRVTEARPGMSIEPGLAILAAGGHHMILGTSGQVKFDDGPAECGVRPSVNVTMESATRLRGKATLGVILTGMGSDGTRGAGLIKAAGGEVIAESPETSVIYGMPRSVAEAGHVDAVVPIGEIADEIVRRSALAIRSPGATP